MKVKGDSSGAISHLFLPPQNASAFDEFSFKSMNAYSDTSVPISSSASVSGSRAHPYLRHENAPTPNNHVDCRDSLNGPVGCRIQKHDIAHSRLRNEITLKEESLGVSESGTQQQHHENGGIDVNLLSTYYGATVAEDHFAASKPLSDLERIAGQIDFSELYESLRKAESPSPSTVKPEQFFDFRGLNEDNTYSGYSHNKPLDIQNNSSFPVGTRDVYEHAPYVGNIHPGPPRFYEGSLGGWNASTLDQPAHQQHYDYVRTYQPSLLQQFDLYPGPMYHDNGGCFYQKTSAYNYEVQETAERDYENIDPVLRPPVVEYVQHVDVQDQDLPQYSEGAPPQPHSHLIELPTIHIQEKVEEPVIEEEGSIRFVYEAPQAAVPVRKNRPGRKKVSGKKATTRIPVGIPGKLTRASWLTTAIAWKRANVKGARYLASTFHAKKPRVYENAPAVVKKEDLPLLWCTVEGCGTMWRGRKALAVHLQGGTRDTAHISHGLIVNNSKGQVKVQCMASDCKDMISKGGMVRHLVDFHSSVWLYCTMCDVGKTREESLQTHFKDEHEKAPMPTQFREVIHQRYDED